MMMNGYGLGSGWFGMGLWWILLLVALVVALGVLAYRRAGSDNPSAPRETARDILDKRYARGEIGRDEYEQTKRDLAG
jgi:putative membrane protein